MLRKAFLASILKNYDVPVITLYKCIINNSREDEQNILNNTPVSEWLFREKYPLYFELKVLESCKICNFKQFQLQYFF